MIQDLLHNLLEDEAHTEEAAVCGGGIAAERHVLCIGGSFAECPTFQELRSREWTVEHVADPVQAGERMGGNSARGGLLLLRSAAQLDEVRQALRQPGAARMQWIALVTPAALESSPVQEFVSTRCFDFHTLPVDAARLEVTLGHACGMAALADAVRSAAGPPARHGEGLLVGESPAMRQVLRTLEKFAGSDLPVLIRGESGTGKEQAALTLHAASRRADAPFVAVNCASLTSSLLQSELFGHEKGAFTGAPRRRIGRIEKANGGTILLDEVGDLPPDVQVSLLRFLEEHTIERVGSSEPITVDVRVVAATHVDLEAAISKGVFREDLYHRLCVLDMTMPALRERPEDLPVLAQHFLEQQAAETQGCPREFTADALRAITQHDWPGNVRQLLNRISQAAVVCEGRYITRGSLGLERRKQPRHLASLHDAREAAERRAILNALDWACGNVSQAAKALEVSRSYLYTLLERHGLAS